MSGSFWESLPDVRDWSEVFSDVWEWSGVLPGCPGVIGRPLWMSKGGREALPDDWEWS